MTPGLAASLAYFAVTVALIEWLRRRLELPSDVTRKLFHLAVGLWAVPSLYLIATGTHAAMVFLSVAAVSYLSFRFELLHAVEDDGANLGSVLLPLSCALLLWWFWGERAYVAVAGIFAASFGDGAAALVGRRLGSRKFRTLGQPRSMEGTLTLFLVSSVAMAPVLIILGGLDVHQALAFALIAATVAASVETISVYGLDNLTVPLATAGTIAILVRFSQ